MQTSLDVSQIARTDSLQAVAVLKLLMFQQIIAQVLRQFKSANCSGRNKTNTIAVCRFLCEFDNFVEFSEDTRQNLLKMIFITNY